MDSLLVIDDDEVLLDQLSDSLERELQSEEVTIHRWKPTESNPREKFDEYVDESTLLVITDYDLTSSGVTGLFGSSIVSWCQRRAIPVGNFSRGNPGELPKEPDLFELRIPTGAGQAPIFCAALFRGFRSVRDMVTAQSTSMPAVRSPAGALAQVLGKPYLETALSLYMTGTADSSGPLLDRILGSTASEPTTDPNAKIELLAYLLGHVLVNAILRFPGPILSDSALLAYVAAGPAETLDGLFKAARYDGPFAELFGPMYWRDEVDDALNGLFPAVGEMECETVGEYRRAVVEAQLDREVARHGCHRCAGSRGGFWCPLTKRAVCELDECSVGATSWIPVGADVSRVERDFYDEWAPVLGF